MEKHVKIVAILNIAYRCLMLVGSIVLFVLAAIFGSVMNFLERRGELRAEDVPQELLNLLPIFFIIIGVLIAVVSLAAIIGSIGVMKKKEWGRITIIVVSFFNLIHVPLGTVLGVYSLWVLFNDEIVRLFNPLPGSEPVKPAQ